LNLLQQQLHQTVRAHPQLLYKKQPHTKKRFQHIKLSAAADVQSCSVAAMLETAAINEQLATDANSFDAVVATCGSCI